MKIIFSEEAWEEYLYWQIQDKKTLKRINQLIQSIDDFNRLVYAVSNEQIEVKKCKGHYEN